MQTKEIESKGLKRVYQITVPAAQVEAQLEQELKSAGKQVKIPGFRAGHVPVKILKQRYGKSVEADVVRQTINKATNELVREHKIRPATEPKVNIEEFKEGADFGFTVSMEIFPDVPEMDFSQFTINRSVVETGEADIDEALARIAERTPKTERAKSGSKAKKGQVVIIDFKGSIDGDYFQGGTAADFRLELGSGQFIEGFEAQLEGAKEGEERKVNVTFPEAYHSPNLAGKPALFEVTVKEIHDKAPAEITEEFAKERGFEDLAKLREAVKNQLSNEYNQIVRQQVKKELFDLMDDTFEIDLPESMIESEFNAIWERLKQAKAEGDPSLEGRSDEELKEEYTAIAKRRVKLGILLAETGNRNKIEVTREELGRAVMQQASQYPGQERQVMEFYKNNPERIEDMRGPILEEKAVDFILSKVSYNDQAITAKDLIDSQSEDSEAKPAKAKSSAKKKPAKKKDA